MVDHGDKIPGKFIKILIENEYGIKIIPQRKIQKRFDSIMQILITG